jgi:hypothetical protein
MISGNLRRRPTRRDLLVVVGRLQDLVGRVRAAHSDDRDPEAFEKGARALDEALELCIEAAGKDPPVRQTGPWAPAKQTSTKTREVAT